MTKMEEAKELEKRVGKAFWMLGGLLGASDFNNWEVRSRSEAIARILFMASRDIGVLIKEWEGKQHEKVV
jgi:hypothetical protein